MSETSETTGTPGGSPGQVPPGQVSPRDISDEEWRRRLTPEQYAVLRQAGTERAFTGALLQNKQPGIYRCAACDAPLYRSDTKFESGTGWPSFFDAISPDAVELVEDRGHGMVRTEVRCATCGSHLGHVFPDGPAPTGQRHCMNSIALAFAPEDGA